MAANNLISTITFKANAKNVKDEIAEVRKQIELLKKDIEQTNKDLDKMGEGDDKEDVVAKLKGKEMELKALEDYLLALRMRAGEFENIIKEMSNTTIKELNRVRKFGISVRDIVNIQDTDLIQKFNVFLAKLSGNIHVATAGFHDMKKAIASIGTADLSQLQSIKKAIEAYMQAGVKIVPDPTKKINEIDNLIEKKLKESANKFTSTTAANSSVNEIETNIKRLQSIYNSTDSKSRTKELEDGIKKLNSELLLAKSGFRYLKDAISQIDTLGIDKLNQLKTYLTQIRDKGFKVEGLSASDITSLLDRITSRISTLQTEGRNVVTTFRELETLNLNQLNNNLSILQQRLSMATDPSEVSALNKAIESTKLQISLVTNGFKSLDDAISQIDTLGIDKLNQLKTYLNKSIELGEAQPHNYEQFFTQIENRIKQIQSISKQGIVQSDAIRGMNINELTTNLDALQKRLDQIGKDNPHVFDSIKSAIAETKMQIELLNAGFQNLDHALQNVDNASIDQLKNIKKALEIARNSGDQDLTSGIDPNAEIARVEQRLKQLSTAAAEAGDNIGDLGRTNLNSLNNRLQLLQDRLKNATDPKTILQLQREIAELQNRIKRTSIDFGNIGFVMKNISSAPIDKLKKAQSDLNTIIETSSRNTREYVEAMSKLKAVEKQLANSGQNLAKQTSFIDRAINRIQNYAAIYLSFNAMLMKSRQFSSEALQLSDSIADIQKVTKMTTQQVDGLSIALDNLDTRSSQEQLHKLGYQAGLLGLKSQTDIVGFVKAADQMNWALKELGEDGAVQLMKVSNLMGEVWKTGGVEQALTKVGSAINEITANSAASAGPVVNFVSRMGAVGSVCKYSSADLVAIGSTLDALAVPAERGGTAMNKFMTALETNLPSIALKLNFNSDLVRNMQNSGQAMEGLLTVLEALRKQGDGGMSALQPIFRDLGGDGERLKSVIVSLVQHVDMLREHAKISQSAYDEGVSMLLEYNTKNETALATFQRLGNTIKDTFVNSSLVRTLQDIGKYLLDMYNYSYKYVGLLNTLRISITAILSVLFYKTIAKRINDSFKTLRTNAIAFVDRIKKQQQNNALNSNTTASNVNSASVSRNSQSVNLNTAARQQNTSAINQQNTALNQNNEAENENNEAIAELAEGTELFSLSTLKTIFSVNGLKTAFSALSVAFRANPFGFIISVASILWSVFEALKDMMSDNSLANYTYKEASKEVTSEMTGQIIEAERLCAQLQSLNDQMDEQNKIINKEKNNHDRVNEAKQKYNSLAAEKQRQINKLNQNYGTYLGYQLNELSNNVEIADSYDRINLALRDKMNLMIKERMMQKAVESYTADVEDKREDLVGAIKSTFKTSSSYFKKTTGNKSRYQQIDSKSLDLFANRLANTLIAGITAGNVTPKNYDTFVMDNFKKFLLENKYSMNNITENTIKKQITERGIFSDTLRDMIEELSDLKSGLNQATDLADKIANSTLSSATSEDKYTTYSQAYEIAKKLKTEFSAILKETNESVKQTKAQGWYSNYNAFLQLQSRWSQQWSDRQKSTINNLANDLSGMVLKVSTIANDKETPAITPQFDRENLDNNTIEAISAKIQQLTELAQLYNRNQSDEFNRQFEKFFNHAPGTDPVKEIVDEVREYYIYNISKKFTNTGHSISQGEDNAKKQLREQLRIWEKILTDYFNKLQIQNDTKLLNGETTVVSHDISKKNITEQMDFAFADFYQYLVNRTTTYETNLKNIFSEASISLMDNVVDVAKKEEELLKKKSDYELKATTLQIDRLKEQNKLLTQYDYVAKVDDEFFDRLQSLGLLEVPSNRIEEARTMIKEFARTRDLNYDPKQFEVSAQKLLERLDFTTSLEGNQYPIEALYNLFSEYWDKLSEAEKKTSDEKKKVIDFNRKKDGTTRRQDEIVTKNEQTRELYSQLNSLDIMPKQMLDDAELKMIQQKIGYQKEYIKVLKEGGVDLTDANAKLNDLLNEQSKKEMDITASKLQNYKQYSDAFISFSEAMGEAAFGEVEDRKKAAQELLKNTLNITKEIILQKTKQMLMEKLLGEQTVANNASQAGISLAITSAQTTADVSAGSARAAAKTLGTLGFWGIPLVGIITALLGGLLSAAIAAITKSKAQTDAIAGSSSAKKVAEGMLTYADGQYPVLGDDGVVYNARRVNRWQTKLYSKPHYGIIAEKKPELIVDGNTTQKMMTLRPDLYNEILNLANRSSAHRAKTYADGNVQQIVLPSQQNTPATTDNTQLNNTLIALYSTIQSLQSQLASGITISPYGSKGAVNALRKSTAWMQKHGLIK